MKQTEQILIVLLKKEQIEMYGNFYALMNTLSKRYKEIIQIHYQRDTKRSYKCRYKYIIQSEILLFSINFKRNLTVLQLHVSFIYLEITIFINNQTSNISKYYHK